MCAKYDELAKIDDDVLDKADREYEKEHGIDYTLRRRIEIEWELFDSLAYRSLSKIETDILLRFLQKREWKWKKIPGEQKRSEKVWLDDPIDFPYNEAIRHLVNNSVLRPAKQ